jgi:hypothetical protein
MFNVNYLLPYSHVQLYRVSALPLPITIARFDRGRHARRSEPAASEIYLPGQVLERADRRSDDASGRQESDRVVLVS